MGYTNGIRTVDMDELDDFERIDQNLRALIVSIAGTIPGSRGFGLSADVVDLLPEEARNAFCAELDEKVEQYIPEIRIADVAFNSQMDGTTGLEIYVEINDEHEDEDEEVEDYDQ